VTSLARDAMVPDPVSLDVTDTAQEAGERLADPEMRAVLICDEDTLVGVVTRKTLVREVVAAGLHPLEAETPLDEAFHALEEHDLERVPVVEDGRLVGVLSRAVVQRRLAEDEPPSEVAAVE